MCMKQKKVKSADQYYKEMRKDYGPLPSLRMDSVGERTQTMGDVPRMRTTEMQARSLLNYGNQ